MTTIVTITTDTSIGVDASASDTKYVIAAGVDITPALGSAINASGEASSRSFEIDGHLGGEVGIQVGADSKPVSSAHITVGSGAVIDATFSGIQATAAKIAITNHGEIASTFGLFGTGDAVSVENTGTVLGLIGGAILEGKHLSLVNSGTIQGGLGFGLSMHSAVGGTSTLHNSGSIGGTTTAVYGGAGADTFVNSGSVTGAVMLSQGNDVFEGTGGKVDSIVDGGAGQDVLKGGGHADFFTGGTGHDVLTGRAGADVFIFSTNFDADTITDFHASGKNADVVDLSDMKNFDTFSDLSGHMHQDGKDAVLNFGHGDVLTLHDVDFHDLSKDDFLF